MNQKKTSLKTYLLIGGVLLLLAFFKLSEMIRMPPIVWYILTGLFGILIIAIGISHIRTRRASETSGEDTITYRTYSGAAAVLSGIGTVIVGFWLVFVALALISGLENLLLEFIKQRPGIALVSGGLFFFFWGIAGVLGPNEEQLKASVWRFLGSIPKRILAVLVVLMGIILFLGGILEFFLPELFDNIWGQIRG